MIFFVRTASDIPAVERSGCSMRIFFLLLNLAVGGTGSWPGPPDGSTPNPALMVVDYVRAYTPSSVAGPTMSGTSLNLTAGQPVSTVTLKSTAGTGRVYLSCSTNAPKASCSIASTDSLNPYTVDFSNSAAGSATVSVTTTANPAGLIGVQKSFKVASALGGTLSSLDWFCFRWAQCESCDGNRGNRVALRPDDVSQLREVLGAAVEAAVEEAQLRGATALR